MELLNSLDSVAGEFKIPAYFLLMVRTTKKKQGSPILFFLYLRISVLLATSLISYVVNRKIFTFINRLQRVRLKVLGEPLLFAGKRTGK